MNYIDSSLKVVGTRPIRPDGVDKVTGRAVFAADTRASGRLCGKILRSPHAHALIDVIYDALPHVIDVDAAMAPAAPILHDDMFTAGVTPKPTTPSNIA